MKTRDVMETLSHFAPKNACFISSLGRTSEEVFRLFADQALFLDSMGDVSSIACGVALGLEQKYPVVAVDTDGSHLFGIHLLFTLSAIKDQLHNLTVMVLDNGLYESGGGARSRLIDLDWEQLGKSVGLTIESIQTKEHLITVLKESFSTFKYLVVQIYNDDELGVAEKTIDGIESRYRFIRHLEKITNQKLLIPAVKS